MRKQNVASLLGVLGGGLALVQFFVEPGTAPIHPSIVSGIGGVLMFVSAGVLFSALGTDDVERAENG